MKVLGTSTDGNPIVELDEEFRRTVLDTIGLLSKIPVMTLSDAERLRDAGADGAALHGDLPKGKNARHEPRGGAAKARQPAAGTKTSRKPVVAQKASGAVAEPKLCQICEKPLVGLPSTAKVHKGACRTELNRRLSTESYRRLHGKRSGAAPRDKVCVACKRPFHDASKTNSRKTCDACRQSPGSTRKPPEPAAAHSESPPRVDHASRLEAIKAAHRRLLAQDGE